MLLRKKIKTELNLLHQPLEIIQPEQFDSQKLLFQTLKLLFLPEHFLFLTVADRGCEYDCEDSDFLYSLNLQNAQFQENPSYKKTTKDESTLPYQTFVFL